MKKILVIHNKNSRGKKITRQYLEKIFRDNQLNCDIFQTKKSLEVEQIIKNYMLDDVIFCAVGGRFSIYGAVYGALIVNAAKTLFSEAYPELWLFAMGLIFVGVVLAFQKGVAGFYSDVIEPRFRSSKAVK